MAAQPLFRIRSIVEVRIQVERFKLVIADAFQLSQDTFCEVCKLRFILFEICPHFFDLFNRAFTISGVVDRHEAEFIFGEIHLQISISALLCAVVFGILSATG